MASSSSPSATRRAARAVASAGDHPVVVVDDSEDGGPSLPGVEIRRTTGSEGFARAVNVGLTALESRGCRLALVLNDDAVLDDGALETLCAEWTEADGAIAPVLDEPHGSVYGIHVSRWGRARDAAGPVQALRGCVSCGPRNASMSNTGTGSKTSSCVVDSLSVDFGRVVERARCVHAAGATVGRQTPEATRAGIDGHLRYLGGGAAGVVAVGLAVAQVCIEGPSISRMRGLAQGVGDYLKGRQPERGPSPS